MAVSVFSVMNAGHEQVGVTCMRQVFDQLGTLAAPGWLHLEVLGSSLVCKSVELPHDR